MKPGRLTLILIVLLLVLIGGWFVFGAIRPDMSVLRRALGVVGGWRADYPVATAVAFFLIYVTSTTLSLPLGMWLALTAGALFGFATGIVLALSAASLGATLAMLGARHLLRDRVRGWLASGSAARRRNWFEAIERGFARDGWLYLLSLRLLPVLPFFVVNLLIGLTTMSARVFALVTLIGMFPLITIFVWTGTRLVRIQRPADLVSPELVGALAMLAALPWLARWVLRMMRPPDRG